MRKSSVGLLLLALGLIILLGKLGVFGFVLNLFWPLIVIAAGLIFHLLYFSRILPSGVLIPGGILTVCGALFLICTLVGWQSMKYLWPTFILAVAIGLYEYYLFDRDHPRSALFAAATLGVLALILYGFTMITTALIYLIALLFIAVGVYMVFRRPKAW